MLKLRIGWEGKLSLPTDMEKFYKLDDVMLEHMC